MSQNRLIITVEMPSRGTTLNMPDASMDRETFCEACACAIASMVKTVEAMKDRRLGQEVINRAGEILNDETPEITSGGFQTWRKPR